MDFVKWGLNPWGQNILTHVSWTLFWASLFAGLMFLIAHGSYMLLSAHRKRSESETDTLEAAYSYLPARIERHSLMARAFHWVMAAAMFGLLLTAFLPVVGVQFAWVTWHWIAGLVLTGSIVFHILHASLWLDFWSIWVGPKDIPELKTEFLREVGKEDVPGPRPGKYPLGNRLYHLAVMVAGLGHALALLQDRREALRVAKDLERLRADKTLFAYEIGVIHATPVVVNGYVYFGTVNKAAFYKLTPDGQVKWSFRLNEKDDRVNAAGDRPQVVIAPVALDLVGVRVDREHLVATVAQPLVHHVRAVARGRARHPGDRDPLLGQELRDGARGPGGAAGDVVFEEGFAGVVQLPPPCLHLRCHCVPPGAMKSLSRRQKNFRKQAHTGKFFPAICPVLAVFRNKMGGWSGRRDSNPRQPAWKAGALPLSYPRPLSMNYTRRVRLLAGERTARAQDEALG